MEIITKSANKMMNRQRKLVLLDLEEEVKEVLEIKDVLQYFSER